ncbi:MAG: HEAT repeat domain-containing protein [Calditrichaeota bacterium]|nr:MAG: HEAT repeat domain-containing protein [Calditrichota bacterium]
MAAYEYSEPVAKLITLGKPEGSNTEWLDYTALGITKEHIPELIRLMEDRDLWFVEPPEDMPEGETMPEWFAGIHAWRALARLKAEEAIPALVEYLRTIEENDNDWYLDEAPDVFAQIGPAAIPRLTKYLENPDNPEFSRACAAISLVHIAKTYPETRDGVVSTLASLLENYEQHGDVVNAYLVDGLMELNAGLEHLDIIRKAFEAHRVDVMLRGDFEDIQVQLGLKEKPKSPLPVLPDIFRTPTPKYKSRNKKKAQARKIAKASRRKNRPKKKKKKKK